MNVLVEWLGDGGKPVDQELAEERANVCRSCPENVEPKWWERAVKDPIAMVIREHLAVKHGLGLKLPEEDNLGVCAVCGCCTPLKAYVPIKHIQDHTTEYELSKFPEHCWIRKELNQ